MIEICSVLGALAVCASILTALSELMPYISKKDKYNGIIHTVQCILQSNCNAEATENLAPEKNSVEKV